MAIGNIRVTQQSIADRTLNGLQGSLDRVSSTQEKLSTGKLINRPSDSPTGLVSSLQLRSDLSRYDQWERNASDGLSFLGTIDTTLSSSMSSLQRVRELVVQGSNSGAMGQQQRDAIAAEIATLKEQLVAVANTTYLGRPVLGGVTGQPKAYDASGAFVGDATAPVLRTVGPSSQVRVDMTGPEIFGTQTVPEPTGGPTDLFGRLDRIVSDLKTNPAGLSGDLSALDGHISKMTSALADVGARYKHLEAMKDMAVARHLDLSNQLADVEDVDMAKTIMELQIQQQSYQTALGAAGKVLQPSLLEFLR